MAEFKVGKVIHYYDKIGVAVVELSGSLAVGETIKISGHDRDFTMTVESLQIEHEQLKEAKKKQTVGMKVTQEVKEGDEIFRVTA